jgi:hypothetical protein
MCSMTEGAPRESLSELRPIVKGCADNFHNILRKMIVGTIPIHQRKMFHMCWALSDGSPKLIPIDEQPNHQIVPLVRRRTAKGTTHEPLDSGPEIEVLALDFLRIFLAHVVFLGIAMPLGGSPAVRGKLRDAHGLQERLSLAVSRMPLAFIAMATIWLRSWRRPPPSASA